MKRLTSFLSLFLLAAACAIAALGTAHAQNVAPPLPSAQATYQPTVAPTPVLPPGVLPQAPGSTAGVTIGGKPKATPAPPKDTEENRVGITGVWEVALQKTDGVVYSHFKITQIGTALTGVYLDENGKRFPLAGTNDGKKVQLVVSLANGNTLRFSGAAEGNSDMVGTLTTSNDLLGFTAAYRPKYKWIDNISPGGSGLGGMSGNPGGNP
ncbi:MAG: hypothetical protein ABR508_08345 [Candidatus Baltobacteraceae bacterium]